MKCVMLNRLSAHALEYIQDPPGKRKFLGLSLSGGGFRATPFHFGAVRRLNKLVVLKKVSTLSSVSGGSIADYMTEFTEGRPRALWLDSEMPVRITVRLRHGLCGLPTTYRAARLLHVIGFLSRCCSFTAVTRVQIPSGTPIPLNTLRTDVRFCAGTKWEQLSL